MRHFAGERRLVTRLKRALITALAVTVKATAFNGDRPLGCAELRNSRLTPVAGHLVDVLKRLEYRGGTNLAGIGDAPDYGVLARRRAASNSSHSPRGSRKEPLGGNIGIVPATRAGRAWAADRKQRPPACHGPSRGRAQRHHREFSRVARSRTSQVREDRYREVVAHLCQRRTTCKSPVEAVAAALKQWRGAFAAFSFVGQFHIS